MTSSAPASTTTSASTSSSAGGGRRGGHRQALQQVAAELDKLECLYTYLTGSWADALYSDQVLLLRKLILAQGLPKRQTKLRETIQQGVLELVKENVQDFPKYTLPYTGGY